MDAKPVALLGGGLWGCLLAYCLKQVQPGLNFKLYVEGTKLGDDMSVPFRSEEVGIHLNWLKPLIQQSWNSHLAIKNLVENGIHLIDSESLHKTIYETIKDHVIFEADMDLERVLEDCSYIIDTRNNFYYQALGFTKVTEMWLKVENHQLKTPLTFDVIPDSRHFRFLQLFPLPHGVLLAREIRSGEHPSIMGEEFESALTDELKSRKIEITEVLKRTSSLHRIPKKGNYQWNEGRIIRLSGFVHEVTGSILPYAVRIISQIASSSMRLGEVKHILADYRHQHDEKNVLKMLIQKLMRQSQKNYTLPFFHYLSPRLRRKFYSGDLSYKDMLQAPFDISWMKGRFKWAPTPLGIKQPT